MLPLSTSQRIVTVEVGSGDERRWLVLGVTPPAITTLHTMAPQASRRRRAAAAGASGVRPDLLGRACPAPEATMPAERIALPSSGAATPSSNVRLPAQRRVARPGSSLAAVGARRRRAARAAQTHAGVDAAAAR